MQLLISSLLLLLAAASSPSSCVAGWTINLNAPTSYKTTISDKSVIYLRSMAQYSLYAYCADSKAFVDDFNCRACTDTAPLGEIRPIYSSEYVIENALRIPQFQGYVGVNNAKRTIYVGFQGSVHWMDYIYSMRIMMRDLDLPNTPTGVRVHSGYLDSYKKMRNDILSNFTLTRSQYPKYKVHIVGHSYGCVLASLFSADIVLSNLVNATKVSLTGFGCPRVGNRQFARLIDSHLKLKRTQRVVHSYDIISHYVPRIFSYRHFGIEYWLDVKTKRIYECDDVREESDESTHCSNSVTAYLWSRRAHDSYWDQVHERACASVVNNVLESNSFDVSFLPMEILRDRGNK